MGRTALVLVAFGVLSVLLTAAVAWLAMHRPGIERLDVETRSRLVADYSVDSLARRIEPLDPDIVRAAAEDEADLTQQATSTQPPRRVAPSDVTPVATGATPAASATVRAGATGTAPPGSTGTPKPGSSSTPQPSSTPKPTATLPPPTLVPTLPLPTLVPTLPVPTLVPTVIPTLPPLPTLIPTALPTFIPTLVPTLIPTSVPTSPPPTSTPAPTATPPGEPPDLCDILPVPPPLCDEGE